MSNPGTGRAFEILQNVDPTTPYAPPSLPGEIMSPPPPPEVPSFAEAQGSNLQTRDTPTSMLPPPPPITGSGERRTAPVESLPDADVIRLAQAQGIQITEPFDRVQTIAALAASGVSLVYID